MDLVGTLKADLFREPHRRRATWLVVGFGIIAIVLGITGGRLAATLGPFYYVRWSFILLGFGFLLMGTADFLPENRRWSGGLLRIAGIVAWVLYAVVLVFL